MPLVLPSEPEKPETEVDMFEAVVERVRRHNEESGWTVLEVTRNGAQENWVGVMPSLREGLTIVGRGAWQQHKDYGPQFKVQSVVIRMPSGDNPEALYQSLEGLVKGIGIGTLRKLGNELTPQGLRAALEANDLAKISAVKGVGDTKASRLCEAYQKDYVECRLSEELFTLGIKGAIAQRVLKRWGSKAPEIIRADPYILALDIEGVGFSTADKMAKEHNLVPPTSDLRVQAGILQIFEYVRQRGHCYVTRRELVKNAGKLLEVKEELIHRGISALEQRKKLVVEIAGSGRTSSEDRVYETDMYLAEVNVAQRVVCLLRSRALLRKGDDDPLYENPSTGEVLAPPPDELEKHAEAAIATFEKEKQATLAPAQRQAVREVLRSKMLILTGGPGCGKTFTVRAMLYALENVGFTIVLGAPTGRAAKRLSELTDQPASTIHRLLEYNPKSGMFERRASRPLTQTVILIDEASMLDVQIASSLLDAIDDGARLILVGDVDQLPSVQPGAVLRDLIESGVVPVVRLTEIFRQAAGSKIIETIHRVNRGLPPEKIQVPGSDFYWVDRSDAAEVVNLASEIVTNRLPKRGLTWKDCMVISPQRKNSLGVDALNKHFQKLLNPSGPELTWGVDPHKKILRVGDRVIQLKNDYEREVYNGDMGLVKGIVGEDFLVSVDGRDVAYEKKKDKHRENVSLAYAITCHKFQGSQAKAIIVIMLKEHFMMLSRQWLYTALSRAEKFCVLIADKEAIDIALRETRREIRQTALQERLEAESERAEREERRKAMRPWTVTDSSTIYGGAPEEVIQEYEEDLGELFQ